VVHRALFAFALVLCVTSARTARATCIIEDDGCTYCCAGGPEQCSRSCSAPPEPTWRGRTGRLAAAAGGELGTRAGGAAGAWLTFGLRWHPRVEGDPPVRWLFGEERGVDLRVGWSRGMDDPGGQLVVGLRPILRGAPPSRWRTGAILASLVPGVDVALDGSGFEAVRLTLPLLFGEVLVTDRLAVACEAVRVTTELAPGEEPVFELSTTLALSLR
jgi:hypothetical protein